MPALKTLVGIVLALNTIFFIIVIVIVYVTFYGMLNCIPQMILDKYW